MVTLIYVCVLALMLLVVAVVSIMVVQAHGNDIIAEEIVLDTLPEPFDGFRILFITDIHRRRLPVGKLSPFKGEVDVVLLGGDLTEKNSPLERLADNLSFLASLAPIYAVHGNHDYKAKTSIVDNIIRGNGGRLLIDENVALVRKEAVIWLTGVDYPKTGGKKAYAPLPPLPYGDTENLFRIILVHDPLWLSQCKTLPADLVLSGHTHGGQLILPLIGRRHLEEFYLTYDAGLFQWPKGDDAKNSAKVLISRGFGTSHLPLRWGSPAQMHILTLRRESSV